MAHARAAMFRRHVSKHQKTVFVVLFYVTVYFLISLAFNSTETITFVSDDFRISDKYIYMFLVAPQAPVLSDSEGADVFASCGRCTLTNNKGFMPLSEYDAVLVAEPAAPTTHSTAAAYDPSKSYSFKSSGRCLKTKLKHCIYRPTVTATISGDLYDLCTLCETLTKKKFNL